MDGWLNLGRIVKQQVKHIMALMLIRANDSGIYRHMIGDQRVGNNPFFQPKILWRMTGINGLNLAFKLLPIAAGM